MKESYSIVQAEGGLHLRSTPEISDDNVIGILADKSVVCVLSEKGDWLETCPAFGGGGTVGWVYGRYVTPVDEYLPQFVVGMPNDYRSANTLAVRAAIKDEFRGGRHRWDLQCTEYVQFRLNQFGINIDWPIEHSRNGGKWADIFKKYEMYGVSSEPTVHSAMCFTFGIGTTVGHVAFVENIAAKGEITISEANWPGSGKYSERTLDRAEWRDKYKGKFVKFI